MGEFLAQVADEDINDLRLRLVYSAIEVVEQHLLREDGTLAQAEELEDGILLAGQVHRLVIDRDNPGIEIDSQLACPDRRFGVVGPWKGGRCLDGNWLICLELGQATAHQRNKRSTNMQRGSVKARDPRQCQGVEHRTGKNRNKAKRWTGPPRPASIARAAVLISGAQWWCQCTLGRLSIGDIWCRVVNGGIDQRGAVQLGAAKSLESRSPIPLCASTGGDAS